jgi:carbonic anhydrase/acetyltransferase-like protein (isoleucine patch superfamily)
MDRAARPSPYRFVHETPRVGARVYIDARAQVSGAVELGDDVSIWPMAVLRGDVNRITVGPRSNIQDASVLHVTHESDWQPDGLPLVVGAEVTVAHAAILHACTIGDRCLIGMGAIVMDGAVLEPDSMIAAGALVPPGKTVRSGTLWRGNPARCVRDLTPGELENLRYNAQHYVRLKDRYLAGTGGERP